MTDTDKLCEALDLVLANLHTNNECACMGPQFGEPLCPCAMTHAARERLLQMRTALAAAPQAAPDREALVEVILDAMLGRYPGRDMARAIADALLARGLRPPGPETMAWAVVDENGRIDADSIAKDAMDVRISPKPCLRVVPVMIRVVERGDQ